MNSIYYPTADQIKELETIGIESEYMKKIQLDVLIFLAENPELQFDKIEFDLAKQGNEAKLHSVTIFYKPKTEIMELPQTENDRKNTPNLGNAHINPNANVANKIKIEEGLKAIQSADALSIVISTAIYQGKFMPVNKMILECIEISPYAMVNLLGKGLYDLILLFNGVKDPLLPDEEEKELNKKGPDSAHRF